MTCAQSSLIKFILFCYTSIDNTIKEINLLQRTKMYDLSTSLELIHLSFLNHDYLILCIYYVHNTYFTYLQWKVYFQGNNLSFYNEQVH